MEGQVLQQQPDFSEVTRALEVVVHNVRLFPNIPAVDNGVAQGRRMDAIVEQLASMNKKLDERFAFMDQKLDEQLALMDQKMDKRFALMDQKMDKRFALMDQKMDKRFALMDQKTDKRFALMDQKTDKRFALVDKKLDELDAKVTATDKKLDALDAKATVTDKKLDALDTKVTATDKNARGRVLNWNVMNPSVQLMPMRNILTGEKVTDCPDTLGQLEELSSQAMAQILRELGEDVPRAERERKRLVKRAFGLKAQDI